MVNQYYLNQKVKVCVGDHFHNGVVADFNFKLNQYLVVLENGEHVLVTSNQLQPLYHKKKQHTFQHV